MIISIRTRYSGPTDTRGSRVTVYGPAGQRTYSYDYSAYDAHDAAVSGYLTDLTGATITASDLSDLPYPYRTLSRSGTGYRYAVPMPEAEPVNA